MGTIMAEKVESFSKRLRIGLDRKSMTQTELSIRSGISKSSISRYLKGDWEGKQEAVYALAGALGVSVSWLMGYDVPKYPKPATQTDDDGLAQYLEELKNRSELRMLFSVSKNATREDVMRAVAIIEALKKEEEGRS